MSRRLRAWGPALLWAACIFALSSRPNHLIPLSDGRDKVAHFLAYAVLGLLLARAVRGRGSFPWLALALGVAYGASDELHQHFVPGRSADLADWVADALGVAAGVLLYHRWWRADDWRRRADVTRAEPLRT